MPGRFDLGPLISGVERGLRLRRRIGEEPADRKTRAILLVLPATGFVATLVFNFSLDDAGQLVAAFALLAGVALAAFVQLAAWRERITDAKRKIDGVAARALDEAVAHILLIVVLSVLGSAACVVVANVDPSGPGGRAVVVTWLARALSAVGVAIGIYVSLTLLIVVNLLWDAYTRINPQIAAVEDPRDEDKKSA